MDIVWSNDDDEVWYCISRSDHIVRPIVYARPQYLCLCVTPYCLWYILPHDIFQVHILTPLTEWLLLNLEEKRHT